jgi:hypothetical protein
MTGLIMLKSIESKYSESAVSYARELLERCESGDIISVLALELKKGGSYAVVTSGQPSRFEAVGMCMEMANQILADTR